MWPLFLGAHRSVGKTRKDNAAAASLALTIKGYAKRIEAREAACDARDAEAAAAEQEKQRSKKEENQEQQRVALSASLASREVALERRQAAVDHRIKGGDSC